MEHGSTEYKKYRKYIRYSIQKFADKHLERKYDRIVELEEMMQMDGMAVELLEELRDGNVDHIKTIRKQIKDGYYVDDSLCDEDGIYVDMELFNNDVTASNVEKIENFKDLINLETNKDRINKLEAKIVKLERWNVGLQNKNNNNNPVPTKTMVKILKLMKKELRKSK